MGWNSFSLWTSSTTSHASELKPISSKAQSRSAPESLEDTTLDTNPPDNSVLTSPVRSSEIAKDTTMPLRPTPEQSLREFRKNVSLGLIGILPVLMLIPPRRFNGYTFLQTGMLAWATNEQVVYRTGHDILWYSKYWSDSSTKEDKPITFEKRHEGMVR